MIDLKNEKLILNSSKEEISKKFLEENGIETDFTKVLRDIGVETNFSDGQIWEEKNTVLPIAKQPNSALINQDYLKKFLNETKIEDDYMVSEMSHAMDAIRQNMNIDEAIEVKEEILNDALNADSSAVETIPEWSKKHLLKPVLVGVGVVGLGLVALYLYKKFVVKGNE